MNADTTFAREARPTPHPAGSAAAFPRHLVPSRSAAPRLRPSRGLIGMTADGMTRDPAAALRPSQVPVAGFPPGSSIQREQRASSGLQPGERAHMAGAAGGVLRIADRGTGRIVDGQARSDTQTRLGGDLAHARVVSPGYGQLVDGVSQPTDTAEVEATLAAERVMRSQSRDQGAAADPVTSDGPDHGLPSRVRAFMEPRFGMDFSHVRVHSDDSARRFSQSLHARAVTVSHRIYYGPGSAPAVDLITAHELAHVAQNEHRTGEHAATAQRAIELRPPGRGEFSAFDRRQELIDRLNAVSSSVEYRLDADGRTVLYTVIDNAGLTAFDRQVISFIDAGQVIPLRLITGQGRVQNQAGGFDPLLVDEFLSGYVDLEDLLAADDSSFKLLFSHFMTERLQVPSYARRIGTDISAVFDRAHRAGRAAETTLLQDLLRDPSIEFNYEETKPNGTFVMAWRSRDHKYHVFDILRDRAGRAVVGVSPKSRRPTAERCRWRTSSPNGPPQRPSPSPQRRNRTRRACAAASQDN
jgi:hypothetical protein